PKMEDTSQILPPINAEKPLLQQVISALIDGTEEIQHYLSSGCNIILECSDCRSLFRGLPNFICHRRQFCHQQPQQQQQQQQQQPMATQSETSITQQRTCRGFVDFCSRLCNESGKDFKDSLGMQQQMLQKHQETLSRDEKQIKQSGSKEAPITMHLKLPAALTEEVARPSSAPPPHHQQHQVQEPPSSPIVVVQPRDPVGYVRMETRRKACLPSAATDEDNNAAENSDSASAAPEFDDEAYRRLGKRTDCDVKRLVCCLCSLQLPSLLHLETHLEWLHSSQRSTKAARHCPACRLVFPTSTDCLVHLRMRHGVTPETARIPNDLLLKMKLAEQRERERVHHRVRLSDPTSAGSNVNHHNNNNNNNNNKISDSSCSQAKKRCKMPPRRHARSAFFGGSKRSRSGRRLTHSVGKRDSAASTSVAGNGSSHGDRAQPQHLAATHSSLLLATGPTPAGHKCPVCAANFITMGGASLHAQDEHPDVAIYLPCLYCPVRCWARSALKLQDHLSDRHPAEWSAPDGGDRLLQVAWRSAIWRRRGEPTEDLPVASGAANPTVTASGALRLTFSNLSTSSGASAAAGGASDTSAEQLGLGNKENHSGCAASS
ncbi:hypothetical protein BOX15_Mlig014181g2, partial [Macrostomum lignano]